MADADTLTPKGPPPPWIAQFRADLRAALDRAKAAEDADPDHAIFDPPEGVALQPGRTVATFMQKKPTPTTP
jgi:hypothetical protein